MSRSGPPRIAYIALGSNLESRHGGPAQTLRAAIERLRNLGPITAESSMYETGPAEDRDQPVFLNAAIALETTLSPGDLLAEMTAIEDEFGRRRDADRPKGPRTLDLDLLLLGDLTVNARGLTLPHPRLAGRRFVLAPLAEIAPSLEHPALRLPIAELLRKLPDAGDNHIRRTRKLPRPS